MKARKTQSQRREKRADIVRSDDLEARLNKIIEKSSLAIYEKAKALIEKAPHSRFKNTHTA
jgi:hypothetical protein